MTALKPAIRVCIIEDHMIMRTGLKMLLAAQPDIEVVGEAADRAEAFDVANLERPNLLLVDIQLGRQSALDFLEELIAVCKAKSLLLTGTSNEEELHRAIQAGATGVVFKDEDPEVLIRAIRQVHNGEAWLSPSLVTSTLSRFRAARSVRVPSDPESDRIAMLTVREREIVCLASSGLNRQKIAEKLCLSEGTVRNYLTSIFAKLNVANQLGLVFYAQRHGLDKP